MVKLILFGIVLFGIYKLFFQNKLPQNNSTYQNNDDENDLIECSICHTFVPKSECKFTNNGCICKDCR